MKMTSLSIAVAFVLQVTLTAFNMLHNPGIAVVSFDKEKVTGKFIRQLAIHHASELQVNAATLQFKNRLRTSLSTYSKKHHVVIVEKKFQMVGAVDVTHTIEREVAAAMRAKS